jgi:bacterioferritin-associated ferredoxin
MYICLCKAITGSEIVRAVEQGARSQRDLANELGVGLGCGRCTSCARALLFETVDRLTAGCTQPSLPTQGEAT